MNGLNPTWLFHQSTLFNINCGSHAAIYFFLLLTVKKLVLIGVLVVKELVLEGVLERALLVIVPQNVMGAVKTVLIVGIIVAHRVAVVTMSAKVNAMMFVKVHVVVAVLIYVVTVEEIALTVVLVPPMQDFKYN